jgi:SpoVK/Ycf46/Vps4 family AAA+-type ATPase
LFGTFLSWMNDHESDVFVVATANDISKLPPEFARAERFDGIFFLDLPGREQRKAIWQLYLEKYQLDHRQKLPADDEWTGA